MEIGKKLKDARMRSGFTQESVADRRDPAEHYYGDSAGHAEHVFA